MEVINFLSLTRSILPDATEPIKLINMYFFISLYYLFSFVFANEIWIETHAYYLSVLC